MARVLVTRPAAQAADWVQALSAQGVDAVALPLIEIGPAQPAPVRDAWAALGSRRLVVFVSANAVLTFFAERPPGTAWPGGLLAGAPGPGTADALRDAGVDPACIVEPAADAEQLDSESLWRRLAEHDWTGASVLLVRGDGGREWLGERLTEAGASVDAIAAYARLPPRWAADLQRIASAALASPRDHVWLFSSSQSIDHLLTLAGPSLPAGGRAVATHPRIAARARQAGFADVREAAPGLASVVACIQSFGP